MIVKKVHENSGYKYFSESVIINSGEKRVFRFYYFPINHIAVMDMFFDDGQLHSTTVLQVILEEDETENDVTFNRLVRQASFELNFIID
jgi:hypothetical protein